MYNIHAIAEKKNLKVKMFEFLTVSSSDLTDFPGDVAPGIGCLKAKPDSGIATKARSDPFIKRKIEQLFQTTNCVFYND